MVTRRLLSSESEFSDLFNCRPSKAEFSSSLIEDPVGSAAHFLAGSLVTQRFRLFRNGGTPLLERREGALTEEIVVLAPPLRREFDVAQITLGVHVSHQGLRDVRARYWTTPARAPIDLASGNAGQLEIPPGWALWDVTYGGSVLERLAEWVSAVIIPWLDLFEDPTEMLRILYLRDVPLLSTMNSIEWMVAEFGRREARAYYRFLQDRNLLPEEEGSRFESLRQCFRLA